MNFEQESAEFAEWEARIERLVSAPEQIDDALVRLARPVMRALKWQPEIETKHIVALTEHFEPREPGDIPANEVLGPQLLKRAKLELESNIKVLERACIVNGRIPMAYASWLWRLYQVVRRASEWLEVPEREPRFKPSFARVEALPPLSAHAPDAKTQVHVGTIDPLLDAARRETEVFGRRRRLLEAARQMLLEASAAVDMPADAVLERQAYIAKEIAHLGRLEALGLRPEVDLTYQAREALTRKDNQKLHAALTALEGFALEGGDARLHELTSKGLDDLWGNESRLDARHRTASVLRSGIEGLDERMTSAVQRGLQRLQNELDTLDGQGVHGSRSENMRLYLRPGGAEHTLAAALSADGCFDVGGVLAPVRVVELERRMRMVRFPTRELVLAPAITIDDLRDAVVDDPRTVLLSLAAGKLLARRYVAEERILHEKVRLAGEVRMYVLDGSGSMLGPRARMRDAILVAELSTLAARLRDSRRHVRPKLYYQYFSQSLGQLYCVATETEAEHAVEHVVSTVHSGGTNIQDALLSSFEQIRNAKLADPDLARAQVVLITDGDAAVDEKLILAAREAVRDVPIGVSIIALGEENPALRKLAARQRELGESVIYQFVSDRELTEIVEGTEARVPIHLPKSREQADISAVVSEVIDEIEAQKRGTAAEELAYARQHCAALEEVGLSLKGSLNDAELAHAEATERDSAALTRRFERWFPKLEPSSGAPEALNDPADAEDLALLVPLLAAVADIAEMVSTEPLRRQADAIEIFERLLCDAGLAPWRYAELLRLYPARLGPTLLVVRKAAQVS